MRLNGLNKLRLNGLNKQGATILVGALFISLTSPLQASFAEPQYPPTIETPVVGETIITPVAPKVVNAVVVVPKAVSENIPVIDDVKPITLAKSTIKPNTTLKVTEVPVQLAPSVLLGGVTKKELAQVPEASISSKKTTELQVPSDVPTMVTVSSLPKSSTVTVKVFVGGKTITLGNLKTDSKGKVILPPLTLTDKGKSATITIVSTTSNIVAAKFSLRSTK